MSTEENPIETQTPSTVATEQTVVDLAGAAPAAPVAPTPAPEPTVASSPAPAAPAASPQKPSLRRMVAFLEYADVECDRLVERAAMIVHVWSDTCVNLVVWDSNGDARAMTSVTQGTGHRSWSWPERV